MRLTVLQHDGEPHPVVVVGDEAVVVRSLATPEARDPLALLAALADAGGRERLTAAARDATERLALADDAPVGRPLFWEAAAGSTTVLGIGLNYRDHAGDLAAPTPEEPTFFLKDPRTVVSSGAPILLPPESDRVTAEGELAFVIGRECWRVGVADALSHVAAACTVLDQTAEDVLQRNTRFISRAKNWPTFLVVGSDFVTLDELAGGAPATEGGAALADVHVATVHNGRVHRAAPVADMLFDPAFVVSFLSTVMPLRPGDLITTGTPGAAVLADGDTVEARVSGVGALRARVRRPPAQDYRDEALAVLARERGGTS